MYKVLVTGGAGFIGSHFVRRILRRDDVSRVTVLDALTYAGHPENLGEAFLDPRLSFVHGNILDGPLVDALMARHTAVVHFAAESHVDRSLVMADNFLATNVLGTQTLAACAGRHRIEQFVHVSTDEVYGSLTEGSASEDDPVRPGVPYAASKAASDLVALSHFQTYGLPVCVTRSSNNYGPHQFPEKVIPFFTTRLLRGEKVTLHGQGQHVRNWLHVEDNCAGVELVMCDGKPGEMPAGMPLDRLSPAPGTQTGNHRIRPTGKGAHCHPPQESLPYRLVYGVCLFPKTTPTWSGRVCACCCLEAGHG
ncbi:MULTISPECIES: dTDP-glucose 4,6-dehydratase [unclassified Streptomyces]|uniref:dTDP-glucose 4,6-dehydratase n=1 Tax=unclassified Streptomyces TaxID=2593676 RepID=UPI002E30C89C|nr:MULTISPECIES: GDP-mannose 4,6-dehydratase [unclassified Streptomyces]